MVKPANMMSHADSWALMTEARLEGERREELKHAEAVSRRRRHDGRRHAWLKRSPSGEPGRWLVWRERENGCLDFVTAFYFRRRAERAVRIYEETGEIKGFNF